MSFMDDVDTKHVKRGKFGPLDVYPQEERQKEDELSADFVRLGFKYHMPDLLREYEYQSVGKDQPISNNANFDNDVIRVLLQIVNKREESSMNQIEASKKQAVPAKVTQTFRPSLILMTGNQKTKESAYAWFKQLANNEPLVKLAKKIPVFNKRADNLPEILITLYEYQVPISRAVWYLKIMVLACSSNFNEANKKKKQPNVDVSSEWSIPLIRLLREIFNRLQFYEQLNNNSNNSQSANHLNNSTNSNHHHGHHHYMQQNLSLESFMNVENLSLIFLPVINHGYLTDKKLKCLWNFTTKLMRAMLDQNLLDKQFILESLIDLLEKSSANVSNPQQQSQSGQQAQRSNNHLNTSSTSSSSSSNANGDSLTINKLLLTTISQNMYHFLQSELLSRRLAYFCCKRISNLFNEYSNIFFEKAIKQLQTQHKESNVSAQASTTATTSTNSTTSTTDQQQSLETVNYILKNDISISSIKLLFNKFIECSVHRDQIILLISIVHAIQLGCVQALIWNKVGDGRTESAYNGSPLDFLPCPPSTLLYTYDYMGVTKRTKQYVKRELEKAELCIKRRSIAIETKWTTDKLKPATMGIIQSKILSILDILDKYCYDLSDVNETIEILYSQIFPKLDLVKKNKKNVTSNNHSSNTNSTNGTDSNNDHKNNDLLMSEDEDYDEDKDDNNEMNKPLSDRDIINLLCDWAITTRRCGLHRVFYAVFLIKKRQIDLIQQIKEFNKIIKNKTRKQLMRNSKLNKRAKLVKIIKEKRLLEKQLVNGTAEASDKNGNENTRKRKLKSIETEEEDDLETNPNTNRSANPNNNEDDENIDDNMDSEFDTVNNTDHHVHQNLSKKIKLEPINPDEYDNSTTNLANNNNSSKSPIDSKNNKPNKEKLLNSLKTTADKIKTKYLSNSTNTLNISKIKKHANKNRNFSLTRKQKRFLKQKQFEEKKLYEYPFQKILFDYLDIKSSILIQQDVESLVNSNASNVQFCYLISLFHMLITCKVFSHDQFVRDLIARGDCFRNNLNDIKRPVNVFMNFKRKQMQQKQQQQQMQQLQKQPAQQLQGPSSVKPNFQPSRNSIDYPLPLSVDQNQPASMPPYNHPPYTPLQHQKSFTSSNQNQDPIYNNLAPHSVPTPCKSSLNQPDTDLNLNTSLNINPNSAASNCLKSTSQLNLKSNNRTLNDSSKTVMMSKLAIYVLNLPLPQTQSYQHERNQRFVILYGFGAKKQEILDKIHSVTKMFQRLFSRKFSIDLNDVTTITSLSNSSSKRVNNNLNSISNKHYNIITNAHVCITNEELTNLNQIQIEYSKMSFYDQYSIINKINMYLIEIFKSLDQKNYLPKLQFIQFIFDLMESNMNIFNIFLFAIRLLHIGPLIEQYLKSKFIINNTTGSNSSSGSSSSSNSSSNNSTQNSNSNNNNNNNKPYYFEYLSHFYLNIIGVLRLHLISLVLWKDLATEVFKSLLKLVKHVERPSKCSSHEKCALMLLNEMYNACGYIKSNFTQFEPLANKIRSEKCFNQAPQLERTNSNSIQYQMKSDDLLTSMITTSDHTIDEIENYVTSKGLHYNFVAHVFVYISNLSKDEMLRVANLSCELTNRCSILIRFWQNATQALHHRNTEPSKEKPMFSELLNKINIQNSRCKENFKLFLSILASRHCLILNELIIMVVKTCVMACPGITNDQSHNFAILEPSASLACHIIQYLFTSSPKPLLYRRSTTDQRMITASFRCIQFNSFLLVLKCLFLLSEPNNKKEVSNNRMNRNNSMNSASNRREDRNNDEQLELDQFAVSVLQEICEHDWIKERCFHEGDNLLKANQLLEPALGRRAQNLLHIICYPQSHDLRKQNEQSSTKDFIRIILQNLDIWTIRESLLEFKLMIELEKNKERSYHEYSVECLAKTTVDFLIDLDKTPNQSSGPNILQRSTSQIDTTITQQSSQTETQSDKELDTQSLKSPSNAPVESTETNQTEDTSSANNQPTNNLENISDSILAETDLNINIDLDQPNQMELDEFENFELNKPNQPNVVWLIAPLISRLPDSCQLKVLESASKTLQDLGKAFWNAKNKVEKETQVIKNIIAWNQQPFLSLLISCLKNHNNNEQQQQRTLLTSLFNGLSDFINGKEDKILSEDPRIKQIMMDTMHIRLSLVGSMFDFILKNSNDFVNWAWLFVQLIYSGVIDPDNDQLLFTMIIDMLVVLIHHIITLEPNLDNNKHYQSIIKRISKETKDFSDVPNTKAINHIRKLMPLNRSANLDIMTVDSYSTTASKSNVLDKRRGFKFARKEKINTWELIEGVKNASSLCLSWYGSTKLERKMLRYEYQQKLLHRHKHMNIHKELTYFKEKPEVPNDIIELPEPVIVEPVKKEQKTVVNPVKQIQGTTPQANQVNNLSMNDPTKSVQSTVPSMGGSNADIVVIGSTMPYQGSHDMLGSHQHPHPHSNSISHPLSNPHQQPLGPHHLIHQPINHPIQSAPHHPQLPNPQHQQLQQHPQQQMMNQHHPSQVHSQVLNRLHSQMQQHQQQQQQQQQMMQNSGLQLPISQTNMPPKGPARQVSTPDKQRPNMPKKSKSTTPRKSNVKAAANMPMVNMTGPPGVGATMGNVQQPIQPMNLQNKPLNQPPASQPVAPQYQQNQMINNQGYPNQPTMNRQMSNINQQPGMPQQPNMINNSMIPNNIAQQPTNQVPPIHQRMPIQPNMTNQQNQQNFYPNQQPAQVQTQLHPPPQSLTPQPTQAGVPNQSQYMQNQQPGQQSNASRIMPQQPPQQQQPPQTQQQQQPNRMGYNSNLAQAPNIAPNMQQQLNPQQQQQQQVQQRKVVNPPQVVSNQPQVLPNQQKQVPAYQGPPGAQPRMMTPQVPQQAPQQQQQMFQGNNSQMYNQQNMVKQTSLPVQRTTTPDPMMMSQNNQAPLLPKQSMQPSTLPNQNYNPNQPNFIAPQSQQGQRMPIQQQQQQQPQQHSLQTQPQRMQFNPNQPPNQGLSLPTQPVNTTQQTQLGQNMNWQQQQQQQQQRQQMMQRQQQQQQQPQQPQFQQQYLQKQLANGPMNQQQQPQNYNLAQQPGQLQQQQIQQRQIAPQQQQPQQQYPNY